MKYCDLRPAVAAYREGRNVMQTLRDMLGEKVNTPQIIEIAYDLQAGSYIAYVRANRKFWRAYTFELATVLRDHIAPGDRVLDVGCGPGRHVVTLARRGVLAVGADVAPAAVRHARARGGAVLLGSIFAPVTGLPSGSRTWNSVRPAGPTVSRGADPGGRASR